MQGRMRPLAAAELAAVSGGYGVTDIPQEVLDGVVGWSRNADGLVQIPTAEGTKITLPLGADISALPETMAFTADAERLMAPIARAHRRADEFLSVQID